MSEIPMTETRVLDFCHSCFRFVSNFVLRISNLEDKGFSLIELLLVMTLAPIVFFSVYSNFSAGVRIWSTVVRQTPEEDLNIFYYKTRRDLENMLRYASIPFSGEKDEIMFASAVEAIPPLGGKRGIGQAHFFYDSSSKTIKREIKNFSELYRDSPGQETVLLKGVSSFELSYLFFSSSDHGAVWGDSWGSDKDNLLPLAVKMSFFTESGTEKQERIIFIPAGGKFK